MSAADFESAFSAEADVDANDLWREMGRKRFEAAYDPEDCVYEELTDGSK